MGRKKSNRIRTSGTHLANRPAVKPKSATSPSEDCLTVYLSAATAFHDAVHLLGALFTGSRETTKAVSGYCLAARY